MAKIAFTLEQDLDMCIKCNICTAACPVSAVTDLFPGPKYVGPQAQRFRNPTSALSPDASVDYCSGCRACNEVCPTGVPIAELNARARAQMVRARGLSLRNRLLGRSELLGRLGTPVAPFANWALSQPILRWLAEKTLKIDRRAPLPRWAGHTLRGWFRRTFGRVAQPHTQPSVAAAPVSRKVVYFHGCSTNYYEPHVGRAAIEVLRQNGCEVVVASQRCCGLPMLSNGEFSTARRFHRANVRRLTAWIRRGYVVVGTSTSCTLTLKDEAPELLGLHGDAVQLLAEHTYDIFEYLRLLDQAGLFNRQLGPVPYNLPYHPPCQLKAHRIGLPARDILSHIPQLVLATSHVPCCGIAGTYGLKTEKYPIAMDVGRPLFGWLEQQQATTALCDSETCRWQITHATGLETRHPIEILHAAYSAYATPRS